MVFVESSSLSFGGLRDCPDTSAKQECLPKMSQVNLKPNSEFNTTDTIGGKKHTHAQNGFPALHIWLAALGYPDHRKAITQPSLPLFNLSVPAVIKSTVTAPVQRGPDGTSKRVNSLEICERRKERLTRKGPHLSPCEEKTDQTTVACHGIVA